MTENKFISVRAVGTTRVITRTYKKGQTSYRYNRERNVCEDVFIEQNCLIDVVERWNKEGAWEVDEILWHTAREIPPPPPAPPKPPGFFKRAWSWVKARLTKTKLPAARLLKG